MYEPGEVGNRDARPTRSPGLTLAGLLGGALLVAMVIGQLTDPTPAPRPPTAVGPTSAPDLSTTPEPDVPTDADSLRQCPMELGGLVIGDHPRVFDSALERWDCGALNGPWSVVIRAADGHFGVHSAVVTFPIDPEGSGVPSTRPQGGVWNPGAHKLVWPLGAAHAQIVGDLGQATLEDLAMRITLDRLDTSSDGRPSFWALDGFTAAATITYRPPIVHEIFYSNGELGEGITLGSGSVITGVMSAASYESLAFGTGSRPAGLVRGEPAIYSGVHNGRGTLAWESAPGQVAYIGFTGSAARADAIEVLRRLANEGRLLTPAQWRAKDRAQVDLQTGTLRRQARLSSRHVLVEAGQAPATWPRTGPRG